MEDERSFRLPTAGVSLRLIGSYSRVTLTPHIERFMRSLKDECLHRMIFFGERSLKTGIVAFLTHYHAERNHQGLGNRLIEPGQDVGSNAGEVACRERLGGMLRYYHRKAA